MPCIIADRIVSRDASGGAIAEPGRTVIVAPTFVPVFEVIDEMRIMFDPRVSDVSDTDGAWSISLPWPSESDPTTVQFTITLPDGSALVGTVPEGVAGPLSMHDLKQDHGWALVKTTAVIPIAIQGPPGPVGMTWRGAYSGATAYAVRDAVSYGGASYYCTVAATGIVPTDTGHWALIADKGQDGQDGDPGPVGVTWRGAYSGATAYAVRDAVSYGGASYYCTVAATGIVPTDTGHWALIADKGQDGAGQWQCPPGTAIQPRAVIAVDGTLLVATDDAGNNRTVLSAPGLVPSSRAVIAGAGLAGGGTLTGDPTISMPNVGPGAGTIGSAGRHIVSLTTDAQGRVTAASDAADVSGISGLTAGKVPRATSAIAIADGSLTDDGAGNVALPGSLSISAAKSTGWGTSHNWNTQAKATAGAITASDHYIVANTSGGAVAYTLPTSPSTGRELVFVDGYNNAGTNNITISPAAGQTINGASTAVVINTNSGGIRLLAIGASAWITVGPGAIKNIDLPLGAAYTALGGGWQLPRYSMDERGMVRLSGVVSTAAGANPIATLPTGFRPKRSMLYYMVRNVSGAPAPCIVTVTTAGAVNNGNGADGGVYLYTLDFISFIASQFDV